MNDSAQQKNVSNGVVSSAMVSLHIRMSRENAETLLSLLCMDMESEDPKVVNVAEVAHRAIKKSLLKT